MKQKKCINNYCIEWLFFKYAVKATLKRLFSMNNKKSADIILTCMFIFVRQ